MKILVTGADGFIGKHLVRKLSQIGHTVFAHSISDGDISKKDALDEYHDIEYVYHLAARTFVPDSWDKSFDYYQTNVMGTVTVLEFCKAHRCSLSLMSTYVYGEPKYLPVDEEHQVKAVTPYHESKLICESLAEFYANNFGLNICVFRPFNVYGEGQDGNFLIPALIRQFKDERCELVKVTDLSPKRDYVYIDDVIDILSKACKININGYEVFNVGSGVSLSVEAVINVIKNVLNVQKPYCATSNNRRGEVSDSLSSVKKINTFFGKKDRTSLVNGLQNWLNGGQKI